MMDGAKRNGEFIAHFQAEPSGLRVAHVVRMRGIAPAYEARLTRDEAQMLLAANSFRLTERQNALVDLWTGTFGWQEIGHHSRVV